MKRIIKNSVMSSKSTDAQREYEYRKNIYLKRKHEFETLGEDDNNDVLSREEKMNIAKAEMDKVNPKSVKSAKDATFKNDKRLSTTSERYKGYLIVLDRGGDGYNVYDKHRELEDAGYPSKEAARNFIDELVSEADDEIESSVDIDEETEDPKWICLDIKHVRDSDGMLTDYALYTTEDEDKYICMFGDVDAYPPDEMYADAEFDSEEEALEWFEDYTGPGDEDEDEDYDVYLDDIDSAEELDEDEDDLDHPDQEFDSADTSINSTKLPAIYKMITIPEGSVGLDFGGGKWDNAIEHIRDLGATLCVYDPYNRSKAYNIETLKTLRANGGADWAVTSNVLNVIKEPSARKAVLENISKITKSGAPIYITVYEGRGDAKEGVTKSGYQLNRKTADYIEEIQEVFPDAKRKGKLIVATNKRSADSSVDIKASSEIVWDDLDWNQEIQLMKKYIRNYKGTKIFEDFADYVNKPVEDIIDSFSDAESYGDIRIPERMQLDSEYRNDDIYSSSSIQARNYGGAYDVDPEQYFTREDLVEFAQDVIDDIANSQDILLDISELSIDGNTITLGLTNEFDNGGFEDTVRFNVDMRKIRKPSDLMKYTMPVAMQFINAYQTAISEDIDSSSKIESSLSYLDRIEELMEQGLDEETASREAYAEFYPDEYDADDYDEIYSAVSSRKFWYFTRHGVQPGSVPRYVNILDIVDTPEGTYFLADGVILTNDLRNYEIQERRPEGEIYSSKQSNSKLNQIKDKITKVVKNVMMSAEFGFPEDEVEEYSVVEVDPSGKVEVRAEVDYDGLMTLCDALNPIVQRYDKDSYFEPVQPGIIQAWIENKNDVVESSKSLNSVANKYPEYMKVSRGGQNFSVHYNLIDNSPSADAHQMWLEFQASVSAIKPYDDAEYAWAQIENGHINVIKGGKVIQQYYYFDADNMDVENSEWCDIIIDEAIDLIAKINKDIEPRMVYNSTSIETSADTKLESYRRRVYSKIYHFMTDRLGFDLTEVADYVTVDCTESEDGRIKIEVRAELDYDDMWELKTTIDPVVETIDKNAYFDFECPGVLVAYVSSKPANSRYVHAADEPEHKTEPDDEYEPEEVDEDVTVEFDMDRVRIDVDKSGSWEYIDDSFLNDVMTDDALYSEEYNVKVRDRNGLLEDLDDILKYDIPVEAGEYRISCHITLVYHITGIENYDEYPDDNYGDSSEYSTENAEVKFDFHDSYVEDFRIVD